MSIVTKALAAPFRLYNAVSDEVAKDRRLRLTDGSNWSRLLGRTSTSGKNVTMDSALQLSAVWACVKINAQAVSSLPLAVYEKGENNSRTKVGDDPIAEIIADSPNRDQTPLEFWEGMIAWLLTSGNAYAEIATSGKRLSALQPIGSRQCRPFRDSDGELQYRINDRGQAEILPRDKVFHIKGFGQGLHNMDLGLSPIAYGTNSIGAAMSASEAAASIFANGMRPSGFFKFDQQLKPEQREAARENLIEPLMGNGKTGGIGLLEAGTEWQSVSLNPEDSQMLETRRFDVEDVCRWFGTPPVVIGHSAEGQTMWGSGVEQILLSWLTLGVDPICDRVEARIKKQLLRPTGRRDRYAEFNREALLQMDSTAKANFYASGVQNGWMTRGEVRGKQNLPALPDTDALTAQTNLTTLGQLGKTDAGSQARAAMRAFLQIDEKDGSDEQT